MKTSIRYIIALIALGASVSAAVDVPWRTITGTPTTLSGYGITNAQPLDSDLTAIAALATTANGRSLLTASALTAAGLGLTNGAALDTIAGNGSAYYLARANHTGTQAWSTLTGTPTTLSGYGITDAQPLDSDLTAIAALATTANGRSLLTASALTAAALGLTNGAAIDALGALASNGLLARTASNTYAARTLTGTAGQVTITNGDGIIGNPIFSLPAALTGIDSVTATSALALRAGGSTAGTVLPTSRTLTTLAYEGDSLSAPVSEGRSNYYLTVNAYFSSATGNNIATGGDTAQAMVSEYTTQGRRYRPAAAGDDALFFHWAGINDILSSGRTSVQVYNDLKAVWAAARADGYRVVAFTLTPSTGYSGGTETTRLAVNTSIRSDPTLYDFLIEPDILFPNPANAAIYPDGMHLSTSASVTLGNNITSVVTSPTGNTSGLSVGITPASGATYHSWLRTSGSLGINEDVENGSGIIRYAATYSTTGTLSIVNGNTAVLTLSRLLNASSSPLAISDDTNATSAAGTNGSLRTLGGLSVAKDIWATGLNLTGTVFATIGDGTSHAVMTYIRSGTSVNAAAIFKTTSTDYWHVGLNNDGTNNYGIYNTTLTANAVTIAPATSNVTFAGSVTAPTATINVSSAVDPIYLNRTSGTSNIYAAFALSSALKAVIGIAGNTNGIIAGSASGDTVVRGQRILFSADSGTTAHVDIAATGATTFSSTIATNGGAAFALTAVNSVSPTAPNRTLTLSYGGTTYYIAAKTTND